MQSLKELYRIGKGPSSSHTIGPERACKLFLKENAEADGFKVVLYGSLAKTGLGHGTKEVIQSVFSDVKIEGSDEEISTHPNTMDLFATKNGEEISFMRVYSVGGGAFRVEGREDTEGKEVYPLSSFTEIKEYCKQKGIRLPDYVFECEGQKIREYLYKVWDKCNARLKRAWRQRACFPAAWA